MPAYPKTAELPTEAAAKTMRSAIADYVKLAKKTGDDANIRQEFEQSASASSGDVKISAWLKLLKAGSKAIGGRPHFMQMLRMPRRGTTAWAAIVADEITGTGRQKAYIAVMDGLVEMYNTFFPGHNMAVSSEQDPVTILEDLRLDLGYQTANDIMEACREVSKTTLIGQQDFDYMKQIRNAFAIPAQISEAAEYQSAWRKKGDDDESDFDDWPQSISQLTQQWQMNAGFDMDFEAYTPPDKNDDGENVFTTADDKLGVKGQDLQNFLTHLKIHASKMDKKNKIRARNTISDGSETTMAVHNIEKKSRMQHDGHRADGYQHQAVGNDITKRGNLFYCNGIELGDRNQKRILELGHTGRYAWVKSMDKDHPDFMQPLVCGAKVWRGGMFHPEKCDRMHPPSANWCQIMKRNIEAKKKWHGFGKSNAKGVCRGWGKTGRCPRGDGCQFSHPMAARGKGKKRKGNRHGKDNGGPGGGYKKTRSNGKTFGATDHETQEALLATVAELQQKVQQLESQEVDLG